MYAHHFGLKEAPFNLSPEPRYFFLCSQYEDALACLKYGIAERKGFIAITGEIGTGKTTLCRHILNTFSDTIETALIINSYVSEVELLETINDEFGISLRGWEKSRKNYIDALNDFLLKNFAAGKNAVLIIDEAQNLSFAALEQIRMISNLETDREKLIQIVLIGQPELNDILQSPALRQLNDRITVRCNLSNLDHEDIPIYIDHRLKIAGYGHVSFSRKACNLIYDLTGGNPRRINALCDRSLLVAYAENKKEIDKKTVKAAFKDIGAVYFCGVTARKSLMKRVSSFFQRH